MSWLEETAAGEGGPFFFRGPGSHSSRDFPMGPLGGDRALSLRGLRGRGAPLGGMCRGPAPREGGAGEAGPRDSLPSRVAPREAQRCAGDQGRERDPACQTRTLSARLAAGPTVGPERGEASLGLGAGTTPSASPWQASSPVHEPGKAGVTLTPFGPGRNHRRSSRVGLTPRPQAAAPAPGKASTAPPVSRACGRGSLGSRSRPHPTWQEMMTDRGPQGLGVGPGPLSLKEEGEKGWGEVTLKEGLGRVTNQGAGQG